MPIDPHARGPEDSVHLWGDDEADMQMSDWDFEPDMCGICGGPSNCQKHIEDSELPGMWEKADFIGGKTDMEDLDE